MMRLANIVVFSVFVALVAGCGVDGEPERPEPPVQTSGVTISGDVTVGVSL